MSPNILLKSNDCFLEKYIERNLTENPPFPRCKVVYDPSEHADFTIDAHPDHVVITNNTNGLAAKLLLPVVIGTGMSGFGMTLATRINRGTYFHVKDDTSQVSAIHAVDVAQAVRLAILNGSLSGEYQLNDGNNPTYHDLAEALAFRLGQKRIYSWSLKKWNKVARWADCLGIKSFGSEWLRAITTDNITDNFKWIEAVGEAWSPTPTVEYLRNHIYDENSL